MDSLLQRQITHAMLTQRQNKENDVVLSNAHYDFAKRLNSYAFFKTSNVATSEDLVQDTFMKTWKYLAKGGKIGIMKAFLYHILNNLIVDQYRKRKTTSLDTLLEQGFEPKGSDISRDLDVIDGKAVLLLIPRLPEKYRKAMQMRYLQHLSLKEMALITGQSKNTMAVQVHRGLAKLKKLYVREAK